MPVTKVLIANRGEISCRAQVRCGGGGRPSSGGRRHVSQPACPHACHRPAPTLTRTLPPPHPQRACAKLGLGCVAVFTEPDALSLHVLQAPESVCLGTGPKEYLNADRLLEVAKESGAPAPAPAGTPRRATALRLPLPACSVGQHWRRAALPPTHTCAPPSLPAAGCDAVFPGYGFLSESTDFSAQCEAAGMAFIGPTAGALPRPAARRRAGALPGRLPPPRPCPAPVDSPTLL